FLPDPTAKYTIFPYTTLFRSNLHSNEIRLQVCHGFVTCVTNHANLDSALSCILALRYESDQSWQYFVMHCSLRSKSHQSRQRFVMHLSSALQIGPILAVLCHALQLALQIASILAVLCHALQLALQITPISTALCHASYLCLTHHPTLCSLLLFSV